MWQWKPSTLQGSPNQWVEEDDPSPVTAFGVYGYESWTKEAYGSDDLSNKRIVVQGVGHVGENLVKYLEKKMPKFL